MKEGGHCPRTNTPYVCRYYDRSLSKSSRFNHIKLMINNALNTLNIKDIESKLNSITDIYDGTYAFMLNDINDILLYFINKNNYLLMIIRMNV